MLQHKEQTKRPETVFSRGWRLNPTGSQAVKLR
jgi:hypothetical protein